MTPKKLSRQKIFKNVKFDSGFESPEKDDKNFQLKNSEH
jgi:hypothetical protein